MSTDLKKSALEDIAITKEELLYYNRRGLIPGPSETEKEFIERVKTLNEKKIPTNCLCFYKSLKLTQSALDIAPDWLNIEWKKMAPWHGAVTVIEDRSVTVELSALLFKRQKGLLFYRQEEILAHEIAHVGRMAFDEPIFEEYIASQMAPTSIRRFLGALLEKPCEIYTLLISVVALWTYFIIELLGNSLSAYLFYFLATIPIAVIAKGTVRQVKRNRMFKKCLENLQKIVHDKAKFVLYRLTDKEIKNFSETSPNYILRYLEKQRNQSLRWCLLDLAYFAQYCLKPLSHFE